MRLTTRIDWKERALAAEAQLATRIPAASPVAGVSAEIIEVLKDCCDRDWKDETPEQVATIASNAMFWRNDEIRRLRDKLAQPSAEGDGWIAVTERLSNPYQKVWVWGPTLTQAYTDFLIQEGAYNTLRWEFYEGITHWQPMTVPAPPVAKEGRES